MSTYLKKLKCLIVQVNNILKFTPTLNFDTETNILTSVYANGKEATTEIPTGGEQIPFVIGTSDTEDLSDGTNVIQIDAHQLNFYSEDFEVAEFPNGADPTLIPYVKLKPIPDSRPYKVYSCVFAQSGTNAPTPTVLENTFTGALNWTRDGSGSYSLNSVANEFTTGNKTVMFKGIEHGGLERWIAGRRLSNNLFQVITYNNSVPQDSINNTDGFPTFIEIRVYE